MSNDVVIYHCWNHLQDLFMHSKAPLWVFPAVVFCTPRSVVLCEALGEVHGDSHRIAALCPVSSLSFNLAGAIFVSLNSAGDVFTSPAAAMTYYKRFSKISKLLASTGLWPQLSTPFFNNTIFAPRNSVLQAAESRLKGLGEEGLTNALKYHVVPGDRSIPRGFVAGQVYATLLTGSGLSIKYNE